jgi:hypothetical protein
LVLAGFGLTWTGGLRPPPPARAQQPASSPTNISGTWNYSDAQGSGQVTIQGGNMGGNVLALFVGSSQCPGGEDARTTLFYGVFDPSTRHLSGGQFWSCSGDNQFNRDCNLLRSYLTTSFDAEVSADGNTISGHSLAEGWFADRDPSGHFVNCRRDSTYDGWADFTMTRPGEQCDQLQRGYDQEQALLDLIDQQRQTDVDEYQALVLSFNVLAPQVSALAPQAQLEWQTAGLAGAGEALGTVTADVFFASLVPENAAAETALVAFDMADAVNAVQEFSNAVQAHYGDLDHLRTWANEQSATFDMSALLKMVGLLEQEGGMAGKMWSYANDYNSRQAARDAEAQKVADAKDALDQCLARQGS